MKKWKAGNKKVGKKLRTWKWMFLLLFFVAGLCFGTASEAKAAVKTGFQTISGKTYYIKKDGTKQKGWLTLDGKKYYFDDGQTGKKALFHQQGRRDVYRLAGEQQGTEALF